jgi:D-alanyl-D-alanine carboxypeptidase
MKLRILLFLILLFGLGQLHVSAQPKKPQQAKVKAVKRVELKVEDEPRLTIRLPLLHVSVASFLRLNTDGTTGFYLKRVGGNVIMNQNESFIFYPASTIKVMEHLHAMRRVQTVQTSA